MRKIILPIAVICILIIINLLIGVISFEKVLVIDDTDQHVKTKFILKDNTFTLGYIHSVLLTPAEEFFSVDDNNNILLQKTVYESFGVGLPYSQKDYKFEIKDGKFILYIKRSFKSINMRISPIPKHWLKIGDNKYELINIVERKDNAIKIYAQDSLVLRIGNYYSKIF